MIRPSPQTSELENRNLKRRTEPRLALMKATNQWITYRTRFLVKAKQLTTSLAFTDDLGRIHSGRKGDYLVESSEGVLSIAPRQIFEDVYVSLQADPNEHSAQQNSHPATASQFETERQQELRQHPATFLLPPPNLARKSPQPYRDRRAPVAGFRFL
jgi:hypothetical protein